MAEEENLRVTPEERFVHDALLRIGPPVSEEILQLALSNVFRIDVGDDELRAIFHLPPSETRHWHFDKVGQSLMYSRELHEIIQDLIDKGIIIRRIGGPVTLDTEYEPDDLEDED